MYVCNYGPTGNWIGSAVYKQGTAGSACPADTMNSNGLCVTTLQPATVATTLNPVTTTLKPASVSTLKPTSPGSTLTPSLGTNYCNISTCTVPTDNTLCKYSVCIIHFHYEMSKFIC